MENKINTDYIKDIDQNGNTKLKTYNKKYKMWVNVYFSQNSNDEVIKEIQDVALDILIK
jgi:hypothetical protein